MSAPIRSKRSARELLGPAILLAVVGLFLFGPLKWPCPMATILGIPCPTCGMTRATRFAFRGDFGEATHMHPLWFIVLPAIAWALVAEVIGFWRTGAWGAAATSPWMKRLLPVITALLVCVWIARFLGAFGGPAPVR